MRRLFLVPTAFTAFALLAILPSTHANTRDIRAITTIYPPQLENITTDHIVINAGETLSLTCRGRRPLVWKNSNRNENNNYFRRSVTERVELKNEVVNYISTMEINDTVYTDTDYVTCHYEMDEGTVRFDDLENSTTVYVFVYDPDNFFMPVSGFIADMAIVPVYQHKNTIIPCRPTHPDIVVSLYKTNTKKGYVTREATVTTENNDVKYDPCEGFLISYPNMFFTGLFYCDGVYGNETQNISMHLEWFPDTSGPAPPHIDDNGSPAIINEAFQLTCLAIVEPGSMLIMNWSYPHKGHLRANESRQSALTKTSNNGYNFREVTRTLTIQHSQLSDEGLYTCTITDHTGKKNQREKYIKIYNNTCHINVTSELPKMLNVSAVKHNPIRLAIRYEGFPSISVIWTKNHSEIRSGNGEKYIINVTNTNTTLVIKNPTRLDSGVYEVTASVCHKMRDSSVILNVLEDPKVVLSKNKDMYMRGKEGLLTCKAEGNPRPYIRWEWCSCFQFPCREPPQCQPFTKELKNSEKIEIQQIEPIESGIIVSKLNFVARESGYYRCVAKNTENQTNEKSLVIVSDYEKGFAIKTSSEEVVETTAFTLHCGISTLIYTNLSCFWKPNKSQSYYSFNPVKNNEFGMKLHNQTVGSTSVLKIHFDRIKKINAGIYKCQATHRLTNEIHSQIYSVDVKAIQAPYFSNETMLNGSTIIVNTDQSLELECNVKGTPVPHITWWKNNHQFNSSAKQWLQFNSDNTKLTIRRVKKEDAGIYKCHAKNLGGEVTANITINIPGDIALSVSQEETPVENITLTVIIIVIAIVFVVVLSCLVKKVVEDRRNTRELEMIGQMLFEQGDMNSYNPDLPLDDQVELLPYDKRWEFPKERLKLGKTLGQGAFGRVVKAEAIGLQDGETSTPVAVKMLKERADLNQKKALMQELKVMIHLGKHLNVVNLLGAVTKNIRKGELLVVVEFCRYGNMRHFLLRHRSTFTNLIDSTTGKISWLMGNDMNHDENFTSQPKSAHNPSISTYSKNLHYADLTFSSYKNTTSSGIDCDMTGHTDMSMLSTGSDNPTGVTIVGNCSGASDYLSCYKGEVKDHPISTCDLLCYAFQVARGMEYLASRKLVHRDLAARNILLAEDNVVKICDFGLAKDLYRYSKYKKKGNGPLPIKWMALESVRDRVFSSQSDVWSFGIVLWEFFSLGGNPYPGIEVDEEFYKKLKSGYRMDQPEYATDEVYDVMQDCWHPEAKERPTFTDLVERFGNQLEANIRKYYVDLNSPYMIMNDGIKNNNDYLTMQNSDDRNYVNLNHIITPPSSHEYVNVTLRPRLDSVTSDYLSMQSPTSRTFSPLPNGDDASFHQYDNVRQFRLGSDDIFELKPLTPPASENDPWILRNDHSDLMQCPPVHSPTTPTSVQSDYLFMGNKGSDLMKTNGSDSGTSDLSSGFHSDFAESSAPPSYNLVVGENEYVV